MYKRILVPLDGSELAECVLPHAESIGRGCGAELVLIRVVEPLHLRGGEETGIIPEERERLAKDAMKLAQDYLNKVKAGLENVGMKATTVVLFGKVPNELINYANSGHDIGLVIIASHGRSGISRWVWGSVADRILRGTCVPVEIIRAPGCYI